MKKKDLIFLGIFILIFLPFFISESVFNFYKEFNHSHGMIMSFIKFGILATTGEIIGLRIRSGNYFVKGFGIIPRAIVWGFLGLTINMAFIIFATGTPAFLEYMGLTGAVNAFKSEQFSILQLFTALCTSSAMNLIFAPVMMTTHKVTDEHIICTGGSLIKFFQPIKVRAIFSSINWDVMWNFVFKKTIPLFWIPAHTITFMLPSNYRVLMAALLGIALGIILAIASVKAVGNKKAGD